MKDDLNPIFVIDSMLHAGASEKRASRVMKRRNRIILLSSAGGLLAAGISAQFIPGVAAAVQSAQPDVGSIMGMRSPGGRLEGKLIKTKGKHLKMIPPPKVLAERTPVA